MKLEIHDLTKRYGKHLALDRFSFSFERGVTGILGPNGAGKSTLMGLLTDTLRRQAGEILWEGTDILRLGASYRRLVGYMAQEQGIYEQMTAWEFLMYMAQLKQIPRKAARIQIDGLLDTVRLQEDASRKLGGFSGGMRQRVLLAQALLGNPKLVILDEPTAGLDPKERIRIRNLISEIAQDRIVLLATHVVTDIECIASCVLLLERGRLVRSGTPEALIASVEGKVGERLCNPASLALYQQKYGLGNVQQRKEGQVLRLVGDSLPEGFTPVTHNLSLEDVYLYYLESKQPMRLFRHWH